jgi:hypothetical protein
MSRRVTTKSAIKDKNLAAQALKAAGLTFEDCGNTLRVTSGSMRNASIDLRTGEISGDSDYGHTSETLGQVRVHYSEAEYLAMCFKKGHTLESRTLIQNGEVELIHTGIVSAMA